MGVLADDIMQIITSAAFQKLVCLDTLSIVQFNALCTLLIKSNIPFDAQFNSGTRRDEPSLQVTIYINPNTTITYTFDGCGVNNLNDTAVPSNG